MRIEAVQNPGVPPAFSPSSFFLLSFISPWAFLFHAGFFFFFFFSLFGHCSFVSLSARFLFFASVFVCPALFLFPPTR